MRSTYRHLHIRHHTGRMPEHKPCLAELTALIGPGRIFGVGVTGGRGNRPQFSRIRHLTEHLAQLIEQRTGRLIRLVEQHRQLAQLIPGTTNL